MKTVRRLYFYAVAFISIEVVLWGLISLVRSIVDQTVGGQAQVLARALALILVGMPIFLFHWLWAQRLAGRDPEEQTAGVRAFFFYAILISTLIPLAQNVLALIDRVFLDAGQLELRRAIFGHSQPWQDSLIGIVMNGLVAAYFWNVLRSEWPRLPDAKTFGDVRRLYRYAWLLYSLIMTIFGAQQVLSFLFFVPSEVLGTFSRETLVNGIALLVVGTPVWVYTWRLIQNSLNDLAERDSNLRLGVLYLLALSGVITVLTTAAMVIHIVLSQLLGAGLSTSEFMHQIGGPISIGVPLGAVWAYYGSWLNRHIEAIGDAVRQAAMKRVVLYILSALGLGGAFFGVATLVKFIIDYLTGANLLLSDALRSDLSNAISLIAAWLPLWVVTWRRMQAQAFARDDAGDHARRSIVRRAYLYLALFAGVVGGMAAAVALLYQLLNAAFGGGTDSNFLATILNDLQLVALFAILLVYHLTVLRHDGSVTAESLARKQREFKLLVVDSEGAFGEAMKAAVARAAPNIPVTVASGEADGGFDALVIRGSHALQSPDWLRSFRGSRIIVPDEATGLIWAGGVSEDATQQAAQAVRQLAEGQPPHARAASPAWRTVIYIAAALFGIELLVALFGFVASSFLR
ncbi:MAG TPA: DUF5671 domain-containing protein [Anaerolineae bacterium]